MGGLGDLRAYYEEEARRGLRRPPSGFRAEWCHEFAALLVEEERRSVLDFGAGPGSDAAPFLARGLEYVGVDLAVGNAVLAASRGSIVVPGSLLHPPVRPAAFDAGWSMSTLMHLPEVEVPAAITAMAACLGDGAPLFVGLWGGDRDDTIDEQQIDGERRLFSLRPAEQNRALIAQAGEVEWMTVLDVGPPGWNYQAVRVRISHSGFDRLAP